MTGNNEIFSGTNWCSWKSISIAACFEQFFLFQFLLFSIVRQWATIHKMWWLQKPYNLRDHKQCARSRQRWHLFRSDFKVPHQHISHFVLLLLLWLLLCFTQFDISLNGKCVLIVMISLFLYFPSVLCIHSIAKLANECNCFVLHTVGCVTGASQSCPDSHKPTKDNEKGQEFR